MTTRTSELTSLLKECTVLIRCGGGRGTGFFFAPNRVLTCAHVVSSQGVGGKVTVVWSKREFEGTVTQMFPNLYPKVPPTSETDIIRPDVAVIDVAIEGHRCALLDCGFQTTDSVYSFGYSKLAAGGESLSGTLEGSRTYAANNPDSHLLKFKDTEVLKGVSGSPLLNLRTGAVCGMVKRSRDEEKDAGGLAVRMEMIWVRLLWNDGQVPRNSTS